VRQYFARLLHPPIAQAFSVKPVLIFSFFQRFRLMVRGRCLGKGSTLYPLPITIVPAVYTIIGTLGLIFACVEAMEVVDFLYSATKTVGDTDLARFWGILGLAGRGGGKYLELHTYFSLNT